MSRQGTYYLARVIKAGRLTARTLIEVLRNPKPVVFRDHAWTFTDFQAGPDDFWYFARLTKYRPEGEVRVIDHNQHRGVAQPASDLVVAASPFIYIPSVSGMVYLHIWNQIQRETFPKRFAEVVKASFDHFFVDCELEPISDLRSFVKKVKTLDDIREISARVHLPNPLFGPLWKSLYEYVQARNADTIRINEQAERGGLRSKLVELVERNTETVEEEDVAIGDAAVLMAADGYGSARVTGARANRRVVIRTSETQVNFNYPADATAEELAKRSVGELERHTDAQSLRHDSED